MLNAQHHQESIGAPASEQQWPPEWLESVVGTENAQAVKAYCDSQLAAEDQELRDIIDPRVHIMHFSA